MTKIEEGKIYKFFVPVYKDAYHTDYYRDEKCVCTLSIFNRFMPDSGFEIRGFLENRGIIPQSSLNQYSFTFVARVKEINTVYLSTNFQKHSIILERNSVILYSIDKVR